MSPLLEDHFKTSKAMEELIADMTKVDTEVPALLEEDLTVALSFNEVRVLFSFVLRV